MSNKYEKIHPDIKYGLTQTLRLEALNSSLQISDQKYTVKLKGAQSLTLNVKKIEVDKLKYRIKNNRARSAQNMWIEKNEDKIVNYIEDFSLNDYKPRVNYSERTNWLREQDPEHEIIQKIQHEILNNFNISKDRIFKEFSEDGVEQEEPLIINKAGFVLSGNRRLSCFRQLSYHEINDDLKFAEIVFWNNSTPEQENNVEQRRDGGKPVDEPYDWFSTGEWIEDQRKGAQENGYEVDYDEICRETRRDKKDIETIVNRYKNALIFIAHQDKAGLSVQMEKILNMQQALDEYSKVMEHDKVKKLPLRRKVVFRNMIAPYMLQGKDYGSAYLMIKSAAKEASKFIDAFIKLSPNINNEDELDEFVKDPSNWDVATDVLGRARRRVENDKTKKKRKDAGFNALERMANEDIKTVIEYLKNPNKNKFLLKNKKFPELMNSLHNDFKEIISLVRKFKK